MTIEFTPRDFKEGFWYYRPNDNFPPPGIYNPDAYCGEERLSIVGAPSVTSRQQSKLTKRWVELLPILHNVKVLWVSSKVSQLYFDAICTMKNIEALWIKLSSINSLDCIVDLTQLQCLHLGSSTRLQSIEPLRQLKQLRWLELENIKKIQDMTPLGECGSLVGLGVDGSMWTTQRVKSLEPLHQLKGLRYLSITNLRAADKTLRPLFSLRNLECFHTAKWWDVDELDTVRRNNPRLAV